MLIFFCCKDYNKCIRLAKKALKVNIEELIDVWGDENIAGLIGLFVGLLFGIFAQIGRASCRERV